MVEGNIYGWNHGVDRPGVTSKKGRWAAGDVVFRVVFRVKKERPEIWGFSRLKPNWWYTHPYEKYESQIGSSS